MKVIYICNFYNDGYYSDLINLEYNLKNDIDPNDFFYEEIVPHFPLSENTRWFMTYFTEGAE